MFFIYFINNREIEIKQHVNIIIHKSVLIDLICKCIFVICDVQNIYFDDFQGFYFVFSYSMASFFRSFIFCSVHVQRECEYLTISPQPKVTCNFKIHTYVLGSNKQKRLSEMHVCNSMIYARRHF